MQFSFHCLNECVSSINIIHQYHPSISSLIIKPTAPSPGAKAWAASVPSKALPFAKAPGTLDGSMIGDVGFDPLGFSTSPVGPWFSGMEGRAGNAGNLNWYREAELIHGRIAQLAVLGFLVPGFITLPGNMSTGIDAYSYTNPLEAFSNVPQLALLQIFAFMSFLEIRRINIIQEEGENYMPGDLRVGQGEGERWNPFGLNYSEEDYEEKQLQELKHGRLAMLGIFGLWAQAQASGVGVVEQLDGKIGWIFE